MYALRTNLLNIMILRTLLRGRGTSKINEIPTFWLETLYHKHLTSQYDSATCFIICISTCKVPIKLTVNAESRRKVKIFCAQTVKLCTCVRIIKSNNIYQKHVCLALHLIQYQNTIVGVVMLNHIYLPFALI